MLSKVKDPAAGIDDLQEVISRDVGMSVKALNFVNSAASGLNRTVDSIREAIIYLGRQRITNWGTLFLMSSVDDKPEELITLGLVRAKLCELMAKKAGLDEPDSFFTVGLFSILDSLMDAPLEQVLEPMAITDEMSDSLINHGGVRGRALAYAIELEQGHFGYDEEHGFSGLNAEIVSDLYFEAMLWADESTQVD
jgi:EAL and modified HD-GYP domain-containing signal transduction protein